MQQPGEKTLVLEDELGGEDHAVGKLDERPVEKLCQLGRGIRCRPAIGGGRQLAAVTVVHELGEIFIDALAQRLQLPGMAEAVGIDLSHADEDVIGEMLREELAGREQRMHAGAQAAAHEEDGGGFVAAQRRRLGRGHGPRRRREQGIGLGEQPAAGIVMPADHQPRGDDAAGDDHGHPGAFGEFIDGGDDQDRRGQEEAEDGDEDPEGPARLAAAPAQPVPAEAGEGEHEADEDVDRVEHHQLVHPSLGDHQDRNGRRRHQQHAVLGHQTVGEMGELMRHPAVDRHIGQRCGSAEKARVGGDEEEARGDAEGAQQHDARRH